MRLVDQWRRTRAELPGGWSGARLALTVPNPAQRSRAAALLGPATPGLAGDELRLTVSRSGGGIGPDQLTKLLGKLDRERCRGTLRLLDAVAVPPPETAPRRRLAADWAEAVAALPPDWSDLWGELELTSSDHLQRGALQLAPLNPTRVPERSAFRFRVAHSFGYGASEEMARRCLARLDEEGIPGRLSVLRVLSDTHNVDTQGPVWRVAGKAV